MNDTNNPAFKVMDEMRRLFEDLDPGKEGDLLSPTKFLGVIPSATGCRLTCTALTLPAAHFAN
jgi:hypothetical protein